MLKRRRRCPQCKTELPAEAEHAPFCSARCKDVDLGSWLVEGYRVSRPMMPWELQKVIEDPDSDGSH